MTICSLGSGNFKRGIHPKEQKHWSKDEQIEVLPVPSEINIPLLQHIGAPCELTIKPKDNVIFGQLIAKSDKFISSPIHSSLNGITGLITKTTLPNGRHVDSIPVKVENSGKIGEDLWQDFKSDFWLKENFLQYSSETVIKAVKEGGLVGLGGAAFPTFVKLMKNEKIACETLILNGCECEPFLTADYRLMCEAPYAVIAGAKLAGIAAGAKNIVIAIEKNKPEAIKILKEISKGLDITIFPVKTKYPMGGERQLIPAVCGKEVPTGGLPLDVGIVVVNVGTAAAIANAVIKKHPLTHRVVSVSGPGINSSKNIFVPIGTPYSKLIEFCGGLKKEACRIISGGPMMGFTVSDFSTPVIKGTSGITVLTNKEVEDIEKTSCLRCGRCVDVCPLNLVPAKIAHASKFENWELAKQYHLMACCECGCCTYTCPAAIPLVQLIRVGKSKIPRT
ncbi:MAG: hypothetical protein ACD_79C00952G0004 [uncultured bacterium]|nr:MAG: hypothetical protein ACD_79C00952G0004 [uncultured bacterium]